MKGFMLAAAAAAMAVPTSALADTTPAGSATLMNEWTGAVTLEGYPPLVLVGAKLVVGPGGQPGTIRIRANANAVGDPVHLPAEPGTYTFPAPHVFWDPRMSLGFDQETGGHAVIAQSPCAPEAGRWADLCQLQAVTVSTPPGSAGEPTQRLRGAKLAISGVYERDLDRDLVGDETEDRTDLKISSVTPSRSADGKLQLAVKITNVGPRVADLPQLWTPLEGAKFAACSRGAVPPWRTTGRACIGDKLGVNESRTVTIAANTIEAVKTSVVLDSEGPDLADGDNTVRVTVPAATPLALTTRTSQRLRPGVKVRLAAIHDMRARVTVAIRRGNNTVKVTETVTLASGNARSVTLNATGAKLRSLRRLVGTRPVRATVTARSLNGRYQASVRTTIRP